MNNRGLFSFFLKFSAGTWINAIIGFITVPITTRLILPDEFGKAAMFTLALGFMLKIMMLGADQAFVRKYHGVKQEKRGELLWNSLLIPLGLIFICVLVMLLFWREISSLLFEEYDFLALIILILTCIVAPIDELAKNVVRMSNRALAYSSLNVVQSLISVGVLIGYATYIEASFYAVIIGVFLSRITTMIIAVLMEKKLWFSKFKINKSEIRKMLTYGVPFVPTFLFMWILQGMDKIALRTYTSFEEVGLYAAAFKVVGILTLITSGFQNFWIPVSLENYEKNKNAKLFFEKISLIVIPLILLVGCVLIITKDWLILLLGKEFHSAAILIPLLVFIPISSMIREVTGKGIAFAMKTYWYIIITGIAAAINYFGNMYLVPIWGAKAAALSTALAYISYFSVTAFISYKFYKVNYHFMKMLVSVGVFFGLSTLVTFQNELTINIAFLNYIFIAVIIIIYLLYKTSLNEIINKGFIILKKYRLKTK